MITLLYYFVTHTHTEAYIKYKILTFVETQISTKFSITLNCNIVVCG
jgi:hypothetical protein